MNHMESHRQGGAQGTRDFTEDKKKVKEEAQRAGPYMSQTTQRVLSALSRSLFMNREVGGKKRRKEMPPIAGAKPI